MPCSPPSWMPVTQELAFDTRSLNFPKALNTAAHEILIYKCALVSNGGVSCGQLGRMGLEGLREVRLFAKMPGRAGNLVGSHQ